MSRTDVIQILYIVAFSMFIIGLHMLRGPRTAVRGNQVAAVGMAIAVVATLIDQRIGDWGLIVVGLVIGTAIGVPAARSVHMTAMPMPAAATWLPRTAVRGPRSMCSPRMKQLNATM